MKKRWIGTIAAAMLAVQCLTPAATAFAAETATDVQADAEALTVDDILTVPMEEGDYLIDNLDLDRVSKGEVNESPIAWSSSNNDVIGATGIVTRPDTTTDVTITATIGEGTGAVRKDFTFRVPAKNISVNGMPTAGEMIFEDTFSDSAIDTSKIKANVNGATNCSIEEKDGKLVFFNGDWDGKEPYIDFNIPSNTTTGNAVYEYTLDMGETAHYVRGQFIGHEWNGRPFSYNWTGKGGDFITGWDNKKTVAKLQTGKLKVTVYFDHTNNQSSLWLNNKLVSENTPFENGSEVALFRISTVTAGSLYGIGTILVDNVKVYKAEKSNVFKDLENINTVMDAYEAAIERDGKLWLTDNLSFAKTTGTNGSAITYESSDTNVIASDGTVIRDVVDREVNVTVTATDANGSSLVKTFCYVVPGKYHHIATSTLPYGERLPQGTITEQQRQNSKNEDLITNYESGVNSVLFSTAFTWEEEPGFVYTYPSAMSGKFIQKLSFKSSGLHTDGWVRFAWYKSDYEKMVDVCYYGDGELRISVNGDGGMTGTKTLQQNNRIDVELLFDTTKNTVTSYVNGEIMFDSAPIINIGEPTKVVAVHLKTNAATTEVYNLAAYRYDDLEPAVYPEIMAGEAVYSNETPAAGKNSAAVPLIKTTEGDKEVDIIYAVYAPDRTLKAVDVKTVTINNSEHKEYTLSVNLDSVQGGETQRVYIWDRNMSPLDAKPFPAESE